MSDYRDELAAAHERIADLEAKLAARSSPPDTTEPEISPVSARGPWLPPKWHVVLSAVVAALALTGEIVVSSLDGPDDAPRAVRSLACTVVFFVCVFYAFWAVGRRALQP